MRFCIHARVGMTIKIWAHLTKWIGASKLNVSVEHVTNRMRTWGVLDGRLGPDDCIRSGTYVSDPRPPHLMIRAHAMHAPHQEGRAGSLSLFLF